MDSTPAATLIDQFSKLKDPRDDRATRHSLIDVVVIAVCGVIPFQFGYAVNVISESYIVIPAKAGIHTGWLGRTW